jgi:hypothetical protein
MARSTTLVSKVLKLLAPLALGGLLLVLVLTLAGCAPKYVTVAAVHQSVPFKGIGPAPFGDNDRSAESNMDGLQVGLEWGGDRWFGDAGLLYALHESNMMGGPWHFSGRVGLRFKFGYPIGRGPSSQSFPEVVPMEPLVPDDPDPWDGLNPRPKKVM